MKGLLIGCGSIGGALLKLWSSLIIFDEIVVVEPNVSLAKDYVQFKWIKFVNGVKDISDGYTPNIVVLAIKPQIASIVIPSLSTYIQNSVVVSPLAGTPLEKLTLLTSKDCKIVRIMPNIAIKTQHSVNLAFPNSNIKEADILLVETVIGPSGKITWVKDESHIDSLTLISGCGPAYYFLLSEILVEETIKLMGGDGKCGGGIDIATARALVQATFAGSASLTTTDLADFAALRESVTSKGGVTEAALHVMAPGMRGVVEESLKAAMTRVTEMRK